MHFTLFHQQLILTLICLYLLCFSTLHALPHLSTQDDEKDEGLNNANQTWLMWCTFSQRQRFFCTSFYNITLSSQLVFFAVNAQLATQQKDKSLSPFLAQSWHLFDRHLVFYLHATLSNSCGTQFNGWKVQMANVGRNIVVLRYRLK